VREDYSADADAWRFFPFDHARSRAYRWNEDGLGGICDDRQTLCLAFAFWNGVDPFLKERVFGLDGHQGNHGEDAKEYWWYLDSTPTHSWMRWRYMYPQGRFPYEQLVEENGRRGRLDPEYELVDTGVFDGGRYFEITADYAKAGPEDILVAVSVRNHGPEPADLHLLPTLWFRNTWAWDADHHRPEISAEGGSLRAAHQLLGSRRLDASPGAVPLLCDNETNARRLWGGDGPAYPKDGIGDHVVSGTPSVHPGRRGTRAALWYRLTIPSGGTASLRLRLHDATAPADLSDGFTAVMELRRREADEFYAALTPAQRSADEAMVMRQAFAGMLWGKQFYHYDVDRWLDGDPAYPPPPAAHREGRNRDWRHLDNRDVVSMPDKWEYPWYAAWDLGFHCVALAHVDPELAKSQLILICREWYMHPNGQLPAYEWDLSDVNPPVHAWAALRVFEIAGDRDYDFLERVFHKLLINFTWWVNRKDAEGRNLFSGGFLGLDNISPFDRSSPLPVGGRLEQSDGTAWMAMYCLSLLEMALALADHDDTYEDVATKFFEHFTMIAVAMNRQGLWDDGDGFYYDTIHAEDGTHTPLRVRSMVGLVPLMAVTVLEPEVIAKLGSFRARMAWYTHNKPDVDSVRRALPRPRPSRPSAPLHRPPRQAAQGARLRARRAGVPEPSRAALGVPLPCAAPFRARLPGGPGGPGRLRAGGVPHRPLRGQLQLARPGVVPAQLPGGPGAAPLPRLPGGRLPGGVPVRLGAAARPQRGCRRDLCPARLHLPGRQRPPSGLRRCRSVPARPRVARPAALPRVLPRRRREGPGCVPPDRVDRPGGGHAGGAVRAPSGLRDEPPQRRAAP